MNRFISLLLISLFSARAAEITLTVSDQSVTAMIISDKEKPATVSLYRSTQNFMHLDRIDMNRDPIVKWSGESRGNFTVIDSVIPAGTMIYYYAVVHYGNGKTDYTPVKPVVTLSRFLPVSARNPLLVVDKRHYVLSVYDGSELLKRYPINLGGNPKNQKLYFDNRSTPEGRYFVAFHNQNSSFHRSMAVSYPNREDRIRYAKALKAGTIPIKNGSPVSIGGSIMIHGGGVGSNWTYGCIALYNCDIDELMDSGLFPVKTPILIGGVRYSVKELLKKECESDS